MPRGACTAPGTRPSRPSSRMSRISTSTTSSRPASFTASSAGIVSISRSAASHSALYPVVIVCGMVASPAFTADSRRKAGRVEPRPLWPHARSQARIGEPMSAHALPDLIALAWFVLAWVGYSYVIELTAKGRTSLNALMNGYREQWMLHLVARENRIVDAQVTAALQHGTAFFASTSL